MLTNDDLKKIGRLIDDSEKRLENKIDTSIKQLSNEIGDFISDNVMPLIEEKAGKSDLKSLATKADIDRVIRSIDRRVDKEVVQDKRLDRIEAVPVIAHELKSKKSK